MNYIDLHSDTPFELYHRPSCLSGGSTHITKEKLACFERCAFVFDIWSDNKLTDAEAWDGFFRIRENLMLEIEKNADFAFCRSYKDLSLAWEKGKKAVFLGVEGAGILCGDTQRLKTLYDDGVRVLTLVWKGESLIGGAYDTDTGLTSFGREVIKEANSVGIIVDVSHGSDKLISEAAEICHAGKLPAVATHSNSRFVCGHKRNLPDETAKKLVSYGGIIGISLADIHLAEKNASVVSILKHIEHYFDLGLTFGICLGCDFDGASLPGDIKDVSSVMYIYEKMKERFGEELAERVMYKNALSFIEANIIK